jgi:hypothetical protein
LHLEIAIGRATYAQRVMSTWRVPLFHMSRGHGIANTVPRLFIFIAVSLRQERHRGWLSEQRHKGRRPNCRSHPNVSLIDAGLTDGGAFLIFPVKSPIFF